MGYRIKTDGRSGLELMNELEEKGIGVIDSARDVLRHKDLNGPTVTLTTPKEVNFDIVTVEKIVSFEGDKILPAEVFEALKAHDFLSLCSPRDFTRLCYTQGFEQPEEEVLLAGMEPFQTGGGDYLLSLFRGSKLWLGACRVNAPCQEQVSRRQGHKHLSVGPTYLYRGQKLAVKI